VGQVGEGDARVEEFGKFLEGKEWEVWVSPSIRGDETTTKLREGKKEI